MPPATTCGCLESFAPASSRHPSRSYPQPCPSLGRWIQDLPPPSSVHTHTYRHVPAYREIIVGNGGAPLTSGTNFGYVIVARQPDGTLDITSKDYQTLALIDHFAVTANGLAP